MFPTLFQITNVSDDVPCKTCLGDALAVQWASPKSGRHGCVMAQLVTDLPSLNAHGGLCCFCEKSFVDVE